MIKPLEGPFRIGGPHVVDTGSYCKRCVDDPVVLRSIIENTLKNILKHRRMFSKI